MTAEQIDWRTGVLTYRRQQRGPFSEPARLTKMLSVMWKRDKGKRRLVLSFWDALVGEERQVYRCPKCKAPYVSIEEIEELKHCPMCGKASLKTSGTRLYD
jgi:hypothetical protein